MAVSARQRAPLPVASRGLSDIQQSVPGGIETVSGISFEWNRPDPVLSRLSRMSRSVEHAATQVEFEAGVFDRSLARSGRSQFRRLFVTLTYADAGAWCAGDVRAYFNHVRRFLHVRGEVFRRVWVAELQKRGAVHYHVMIWWPRRLRMPAPDRCGWWPHGLTNVQVARSPVGYLCKYASKGDASADFPKGLRLHGSGGLSAHRKVLVRFWCAPAWVRCALGFGSDVRKVKGGWCDRLSGEFVPSPWRVEFVPGRGIWCWRSLGVMSDENSSC